MHQDKERKKVNKQDYYRIIFSAGLGTVLEWYDFTIYAYLAAVFAKLFFQSSSSFVSLLLSYGVFAMGYIARPVGAMLFGHWGDTQGRKKTLSKTILLMGVSTCAIGLLPDYNAIGSAAPILLILFRLIQGIAIGGEAFGSVCFTIESLSTKNKGFYSALVWACSGVGMLFASLVVVIVFSLFKGDSLYHWGWRIPFLLAAVNGIIGFYIRQKTNETHTFELLKKQQSLEKFPLKTIFFNYKPLIFRLFGLYILSALITYLAFIFMPVYFSDVLGHSKVHANLLNTVMLVVLITLDIFFGWLSDKLGRQAIMLSAAIGFMILAYPLYCFISQGNLRQLIFAQVIFTFLAAAFQGPLMALTIDLIPAPIRYSLGSLGYNLAYSLFGGTVPLVVLFLIQRTHNLAMPGLYLALGAIVATISLLSLKKNVVSQNEQADRHCEQSEAIQ